MVHRAASSADSQRRGTIDSPEHATPGPPCPPEAVTARYLHAQRRRIRYRMQASKGASPGAPSRCFHGPSWLARCGIAARREASAVCSGTAPRVKGSAPRRRKPGCPGQCTPSRCLLNQWHHGGGPVRPSHLLTSGVAFSKKRIAPPRGMTMTPPPRVAPGLVIDCLERARAVPDWAPRRCGPWADGVLAGWPGPRLFLAGCCPTSGVAQSDRPGVSAQRCGFLEGPAGVAALLR